MKFPECRPSRLTLDIHCGAFLSNLVWGND
jgi:hypothetical protein